MRHVAIKRSREPPWPTPNLIAIDLSHFSSRGVPINWVLYPRHTQSRLGKGFIRFYWVLLNPFARKLDLPLPHTHRTGCERFWSPYLFVSSAFYFYFTHPLDLLFLSLAGVERVSMLDSATSTRNVLLNFDPACIFRWVILFGSLE